MYMASPKRLHCFLTIVFFQACLCAGAQGTRLHQFYLYEDSTKKLTVNTVLQLFRAGKFKPAEANELNPGFTRSVFWLAYYNEKEISCDSLLLYIGNQHINHIHFYYTVGDSAILKWLTGDHYPFAQRPLAESGFYFPINKTGLYLIRIDKVNESLQLSFELVARDIALTAESDHRSMISIFTGMILLLIIFGIYLFIISGDKLYLWYLLYAATGWLWVLANAGYGFHYLWPNSPWFATRARPVFIFTPLIFSILFLKRYIGGIKNIKISRIIMVLNGILIFFIILILAVPEIYYQNKWWEYLHYLIPLIPLLYFLLTLGILLRASFRGNRPAMFYLAAIFTLILSTILQVFFYMGSLSKFGKFFTNFGVSAGFVTEIIILTAGLVYRFNQYRLEKEKILQEMNKRQQENTRILMEVQEAERSRVANQLHDMAGSLLSAAKLNLSALRENPMPDEIADKHAARAEEAVNMVSEVVRNLSHALSPVMLEKVGFKIALEKAIAIFNASGKIKIDLLVLGFEKYDPGLNNYYTALYSIIYELLNNIIKHSGARHALIQVSEYIDCITLVAEDDGIGITVDNFRETSTIGLAGIQSKINYFGGSVVFDKNQPSGLIVTIELPVPHDI